MNKEQYNNVIKHTLKYEQSAQSEDSLSVARAIFDNMGVALPQGDIKTVYETIKTNDYMAWRSCTMQAAQAAVNEGVAAIGINSDKIIVIAAIDEEQRMFQTASVMTISPNTNLAFTHDIFFFGYTGMRSSGDQFSSRTWSSLSAAKNYYGHDFTYTHCIGYYNYYYTFSDGSRMYFRVA